jgi:quinoprotein dehydrogenase-associated probable ABC transporter substrate-binding protein
VVATALIRALELRAAMRDATRRSPKDSYERSKGVVFRLAQSCFACVAVVLTACADRPQEVQSSQRVLRVCADPNNLPFSNERREGFENRIAELVARDLGAQLTYTWFAQRRGFVRNTLLAGDCDLIVGIPEGYELVETTRPYYRSTYVFLTRQDRNVAIQSFDDPVLRVVKIGVHLIGDDYSNPPPLHALAKRKIVQNVAGYSIFGDYSQPNPPARLVEAVAQGEVDVAVIWGPFAGYFGKQQQTALTIRPVLPDTDGSSVPFVFAIAMGVRKGESRFRVELDHILERRQKEIDGILADFGVPVKAITPASSGRKP